MVLHTQSTIQQGHNRIYTHRLNNQVIHTRTKQQGHSGHSGDSFRSQAERSNTQKQTSMVIHTETKQGHMGNSSLRTSL